MAQISWIVHPADLSNLIKCLQVRHAKVKVYTMEGRLLISPTKIRLGLKILPGTNTLAY